MGLLVSCTGKDVWTSQERELINAQEEIMRVLTIDSEADSLILRQECKDISEQELLSPLYEILARKMVKTVTSPEQDGVGLAAPQVGLSRRIVAVQRFDKEGEPFEVYPNIRIIARKGEQEWGAEGCLSVPDRREDVLRYQDIDISYSIIEEGVMKEKTETVKGFTAVIFQHECDHLDGVLYIDYNN